MLHSTRCGHGAEFTWVAEGLGYCRHGYDDGKPDMWYPWSLTRPVLPGHASFHLMVGDRRLQAWHWQPVYSLEACRLQLREEVTARFAHPGHPIPLPLQEDR